MSDVMPADVCAVEGCPNVGLFDGPDGGRVCFPHAGPLDPDPPADGPTADADTFSVEVTAGLAAIILGHTAMAMTADEGAAEAAMRALADATAMPLDFAAGVLLATSTLAGTIGLDADALDHLADHFQAQADGLESPVPAGDADHQADGDEGPTTDADWGDNDDGPAHDPTTDTQQGGSNNDHQAD